VKTAKTANIGKIVEKVTSAAVNPPQPPDRHWNFPEYWDEFLQHLEQHDPGLLPIIASDGPESMIVKRPYIEWRRRFKE